MWIRFQLIHRNFPVSDKEKGGKSPPFRLFLLLFLFFFVCFFLFFHELIQQNQHSFFVAYMSVWLAKRFRIRVHLRSLVRGALLHDYFLYDWHIKDPDRKAHGFSHAAAALQNAERDFALNAVERDIIARHMFPLNLTPPRYRESILVCIADKICAVYETFSIPIPKHVLLAE